MATTSATGRAAPWHLWLLGSGFVLLNLGGVYDYVMALSENAGYFRSQDYTGDQIRYFTDYPAGFAVFWTIGVWGSLIAGVLLLLRTRWALPVAIAGLVGLVVLDVLTFTFRDRWQMLGTGLAGFDLAIVALTAGFVLYCRVQRSRGVLR